MAFKLGDVIVDRLQFGYGALKSGTPLYALTQLKEATIDSTADSTDITDKDGNLVYRKYSGKKGESLASKVIVGTNNSNFVGSSWFALPQINWETIDQHPLWNTDVDAAVLDVMGLKWNEDKTVIIDK